MSRQHPKLARSYSLCPMQALLQSGGVVVVVGVAVVGVIGTEVGVV